MAVLTNNWYGEEILQKYIQQIEMLENIRFLAPKAGVKKWLIVVQKDIEDAP